MFKRLDDMPRRQWWMFLCLLGVFAGFVILIHGGLRAANGNLKIGLIVFCVAGAFVFLGLLLRVSHIRWMGTVLVGLGCLYPAIDFGLQGHRGQALFFTLCGQWTVRSFWKVPITRREEMFQIRREMKRLIDRLEGNTDSDSITKELPLGRLIVTSGAISLGDPMQPMALVVSGVTCGELNVYGMVRIGKGSSRILSLRIEIVNNENSNNSRPLGTIAIDSAKVVIADREDIAKHWCENGPRRTGVIVFLKFPNLVQEIEKRFELRTKPRDPISAEILGDVSGSLEKQIFEYLNSRPELQPSSKFYFHVETYSSFDRVNRMDSFWDILPIGRDDGPLMLAYQTGYGDGTYPVTGDYAGDRLVQIRLEFGS